MKIVPHYQCETCANIYVSEVEALECESRPLRGFDENISIGDFIEMSLGSAYGWHDEPGTPWCRLLSDEEIKRTHNGWGKYALRGVVTAVQMPTETRDNWHSVRYSILIPVTPWGKTKHSWTTLETHRPFTVIEPDERLKAWAETHFQAWHGIAAKELY